MTGFSSAYIQAPIKRKDLDLSELLDLCAQPESLEDRVAAVQRYAKAYPELKYFLIVAYFCRDAFSELLSAGPLDWQPTNVPKGGSSETLNSMWTQVTRMYNGFPSGDRIKRGLAHQLLPRLHKDDATIIGQLIHGKYYRKELNEKVVQLAFPKETPQDPKSES